MAFICGLYPRASGLLRPARVVPNNAFSVHLLVLYRIVYRFFPLYTNILLVESIYLSYVSFIFTVFEYLQTIGNN